MVSARVSKSTLELYYLFTDLAKSTPLAGIAGSLSINGGREMLLFRHGRGRADAADLRDQLLALSVIGRLRQPPTQIAQLSLAGLPSASLSIFLCSHYFLLVSCSWSLVIGH